MAEAVALSAPASEVFRLEPHESGFLHLVMDHPSRKLNVLDMAAIESLDRTLEQIRGGSEPAGVVLRSGKPGSFIAGADVEAIGSITSRDEVLGWIRRAHAAFGKLSALPCPSVAAIDGVCLGGGTELALACDSRIASQEPRTQIGLPEVLLGIYPGFGGSQRLPRLVGLPAALDLILTGRNVDARRAEKMGLVARTVPAAWLIDRAHDRLRELAKRPRGRRRDVYHPKGFMPWFLASTPFGRSMALGRARATVRARTGGHFPAPLAAIDVIERTLHLPLEAGLEIEASRVADLVIGPVCKNLVRLFQLSEEAKKPGAVPARPVSRLALVGAGVMGGGIAELASRSGLYVRMRDVRPEALAHALLTARGLIEERGRRRRLSSRERDAQLAHISPTLELSGFGTADFALEAVVEDMEIKRRVMAELEVRVRPDCVLASNTSSLSITELGRGLAHPDRLCGFHFFNPVHRMPLVEVVRAEQTSDSSIATAILLAKRLGKTPVLVKDSPGFVVNRVLMPYLQEAVVLLEEGYSVADIDAAMKRFGMPMGPFAVVDEVGIDVAQKAGGVLSRAFPERMTSSPALDKMVAAGRLGKKNGLGFYRHTRGARPQPDPAVRGLLGLVRQRKPVSLDPLAERLVLPMINESARCLEEGVVANAGMLDLALVFGAGFPPFRGGPLRYADTFGLAKVEQRLIALRAEKGERFKPAQLLSRLVAEGGTFTSPLVPA